MNAEAHAGPIGEGRDEYGHNCIVMEYLSLPVDFYDYWKSCSSRGFFSILMDAAWLSPKTTPERLQASEGTILQLR
jgi:hypothetical protein